MKWFEPLIVAILSLSALFPSCDRKTEEKGPEYTAATVESEKIPYRFAVHPLHNPEMLGKLYQPLMNYLSKNIPGVTFVLESSRDYANFEAKYKEGRLAFILPNPWQTLQAMNCGYEVIAMAGDPQDFKGLFILRKDSDVKKPADLRGKIVSYPAPTALAACIMPQYFLYEHGVDVNHGIENRYVGSQESSIMNVYLGLSAAGATWPPPWRNFMKDHPKEAEALEVKWETPSLINNSLMARKNLPDALKRKVCDLLLQLRQSTEGKAILSDMETSGFYNADDRSYDVVRSYVARFEKTVRNVDGAQP